MKLQFRFEKFNSQYIFHHNDNQPNFRCGVAILQGTFNYKYYNFPERLYKVLSWRNK